MALFETHTGLKLRWKNQRITLEGDNIKVLYPLRGETYDKHMAAGIYAKVKSMYKGRELTDPKDEE